MYILKYCQVRRELVQVLAELNNNTKQTVMSRGVEKRICFFFFLKKKSKKWSKAAEEDEGRAPIHWRLAPNPKPQGPKVAHCGWTGVCVVLGPFAFSPLAPACSSMAWLSFHCSTTMTRKPEKEKLLRLSIPSPYSWKKVLLSSPSHACLFPLDILKKESAGPYFQQFMIFFTQ